MDDEKRIKEQLGLGPDEEYLCFSHMGGAGTIHCKDCGYEQDIISFIHGMTSCDIGRQCPHCHAFVVEHNESNEYHKFGEATEDFVCPECGEVIRKKEEDFLKGNDNPLFCPKCHSPRLIYLLSILT